MNELNALRGEIIELHRRIRILEAKTENIPDPTVQFTVEDVRELRNITGCGMMDAKKALRSCGGDLDKSIEYIRKLGLC